jgi:hypothetical protein
MTKGSETSYNARRADASMAPKPWEESAAEGYSTEVVQ